MTLFYEEREALGQALRRHVSEADEYDRESKDYLYYVIGIFVDTGYSGLKDEDDRNAFNDLMQVASEG